MITEKFQRVSTSARPIALICMEYVEGDALTDLLRVLCIPVEAHNRPSGIFDVLSGITMNFAIAHHNDIIQLLKKMLELRAAIVVEFTRVEEIGCETRPAGDLLYDFPLGNRIGTQGLLAGNTKLAT